MLNWKKRLENEFGISLNVKQMIIEAGALVFFLLAVYFLGCLF